MEKNSTTLIGIYVGGDYGILNNHYINFDNRFEIEINSLAAPVIRIRERPDRISNFFGERVTQVSAIVGKNGVGKSTTLRYIKELFINEKRDSGDRSYDLIFFKDGADLIIFQSVEQRRYLQPENQTDLNLVLLEFREYPKVLSRLKDFATVFYSNSLENDPYEKETSNFYNISTGFLKETIGKINQRIRNKRIRFMSGSRRFKYTELKRQVDFLNALDSFDPQPDIPFKRIDHIQLDMHAMTNLDYKALFLGFQKQLADLKNESDEANPYRRLLFELPKVTETARQNFDQLRMDTRSGNEYFQPVFYENIYCYLLKIFFDDHELLKVYREQPGIGQSILDFLRESEPRDFLTMINRMAETLEVTLTGRNKPVKTSQAIGKLQQLSSFIRFFDQHWQKFEYRNNSIVLPTRSALFRDLFEMYYNTSLDLNFLQFKWPSLSAGEESLISYFSRLYSVLHEIKDKHTLMLIDEGDLYFHPEWQRDYIYFLLEFLNSSLLNSPGLQLIVTTHSPFIISDLPSENIILLVKDKSPDNERDTVTVMPIKEQTFGGNLYTLFAKAFFLDDSSTSKFAKNKILTEIIVPLESQGRLPNRGYIRQLIDRIGEPVLRDILSERLEIKN